MRLREIRGAVEVEGHSFPYVVRFAETECRRCGAIALRDVEPEFDGFPCKDVRQQNQPRPDGWMNYEVWRRGFGEQPSGIHLDFWFCDKCAQDPGALMEGFDAQTT